MKRTGLRHFVDIGMGTGDYHLIGDGVSSMSEEFNAETETNQWINQEQGETDVKSYTPSLQIEKQDCADDDELQGWMDQMVDTLPTGTAAETSYVRMRIKDASGTGGSYVAYKQPCVVQVESTGGDAGANVTTTITLGGKGEAIKGTFNVTTGQFTPDSE